MDFQHDLIGGLGSHLHPALGAFFDVWIIPFRIPAIMPIIGLRLRWRLHGLLRLLLLLLNINRRCESVTAAIAIIARVVTPIIARVVTPITWIEAPVITQAVTQA